MKGLSKRYYIGLVGSRDQAMPFILPGWSKTDVMATAVSQFSKHCAGDVIHQVIRVVDDAVHEDMGKLVGMVKPGEQT